MGAGAVRYRCVVHPAVLLMLLAPEIPPPGPTVEIQWQGPAECGDGNATKAMVAALVGGPRPTPVASAEVSIVADGFTWVADIAVDHEGVVTERRLQGGSCPALNDAVALVIAVTVDPLGSSATVARVIAPASPPVVLVPETPVHTATDPVGREPSNTVLQPRPLATSPPLDRRDASRAAPARRRPGLRGSAFVTGGGALGLLTRMSGQVGGGLALGVGATQLEVAATQHTVTSIEHANSDGAGAQMRLTTVRASACWSLRTARFALPLCGGLETGAWSARGFGLATSDRVTSPWLAVTPHLRPMWRATSWLALGLDLQAPVSLARAVFRIDDFEERLVRVGPAGFRFGLAIEVTFVDVGGVRRRSRP